MVGFSCFRGFRLVSYLVVGVVRFVWCRFCGAFAVKWIPRLCGGLGSVFGVL